jgi:hypothetical protein
VRSHSVLIWCFPALLCTLPVRGQPIRVATLAIRVAPECSIEVVSLASAGIPDTKTLNFNYKLRTSDTGGQGQIVLRFIATPGGNFTSGDTLDYQTSLAGPGTPSSGSAAAQDVLNSGIVIARFGPQAHSSRTGAVGIVQFTTSEALRPLLSISCR